MSVHRVMGIETEYGISVPGHPNMNAMLLSSQVVNAYASKVLGDRRARTRWDYDLETPLRDARGFDMTRADADPSQLTDEDLGLANVILPNGARLYVDHAHPEYSSPEVTNPRDAALWDRAGVVIMDRAATWASMHGNNIQLYKNNTDNKGASYGCHENYLMDRATAFADIVSTMIPFFVSRQVFTGAGRVGLGQDGRTHGFQISQRADFFEVEVGLETTLKRPIINTRDEPHADPEKHRRLHVIVGDANLSDTATYLKMGTTAIVLSMIEAGVLKQDLMPTAPVAGMHAVSHDPTLKQRLEIRDGRRLTALEMQFAFLEAALAFCDDGDEQTQEILTLWGETLTALSTDPMLCVDTLDWVAKKALLDGYMRRDNLSWDSPRLELIDVQYSDINPSRGVAATLERKGRLRRIFSDDEIARAVAEPPDDTRAYFRGECIRRFPADVAAASWDSVIFDLPELDALQRVPTLDPLRGTKAHVGDVLDTSADVSELLSRLAAGR